MRCVADNSVASRSYKIFGALISSSMSRDVMLCKKKTTNPKRGEKEKRRIVMNDWILMREIFFSVIFFFKRLEDDHTKLKLELFLSGVYCK